MDYRLVPYIKKYLHEGHSLEQIRQSLLSQGVADADIKQASIYAMDEGVKEIKKKNYVIWIVPILLILIIGGAIYYLFEPIKTYATGILTKSHTSQETTEQGIDSNNNQEANSNQQLEQNTQQNSQCDIDCLMTAAESCNSANTEFESKVNFFGMVIISKNYYEIKPGQKCGLYIKSIDGDIEFSQELRAQSLANGITEQELNLQLEESRKSTRAIIGKEGTCLFDNVNKLKEFLEKIKTGTFNSDVSCSLETDGSKCIYGGDWTLGECTGTMFS
jgi:hypothetical protein